MKCSMIATVATVLVNSWTTNAERWIVTTDRVLYEGASQYGLLISGIRDNEDWCVSASPGAKLGSKVGFRLCSDSRRNHWKYDLINMKWQSLVDSTRCMGVESGKSSDIKKGAYIRMVNCTTANKFDYDPTEDTDLIQVKDNATFCMVNTGNNPSNSDTMIITPCSATAKKFQFRLEEPLIYDGFVSDDAYPVGGVLAVKDENPVAGQPLILGARDLNHRWRHDSAGLFHTQLDDDMCMQAAPRLGGNITKGVRMRLYPCDAKNNYQKFVLNGIDIRLVGYEKLCVGFAGKTSDVGQDPLVLKTCGENGDNFSFD